jgi:heat shock protein HtpX
VRVVDKNSPAPEVREVVAIVHDLARRAGLPAMPEVGIYDSPEINAFATGPSKSRALVAVSSGLLTRMSHDQVEGVLGHEIGHIANGDMVTMTLIQAVINSVVLFVARVLAFAVSSAVDERNRWAVEFAVVMVAQIALSLLGSLVVNYFSRRREFRADAWGAKLAGRMKMIGALRALAGTDPLLDQEHKSIATLKIYGTSRMSILFSTHPPLADRIDALEKGAGA